MYIVCHEGDILVITQLKALYSVNLNKLKIKLFETGAHAGLLTFSCYLLTGLFSVSE